MTLLAGSLFANRFEIDRLAGSGGMGSVYRARDRYSGEFVALKLLDSRAPSDQDVQRFEREGQLLSELSHPGIVSHITAGQSPDGHLYLAMEWLDGEDLSTRLQRGCLSVREALVLLRRLAAALSVAHKRGIVHRDLKPANLFLPGGQVEQAKILDFGIARRSRSLAVTKTGFVVGTPDYMAPEQARGQRDIGPPADIFSLGCVLYECLTKQLPFAADHVAAVLIRILFEQPRPLRELRPEVPKSLAGLLSRMMAKSVSERPAHALDLAGELDVELDQGQAEESGGYLPLPLAMTHAPANAFAHDELELTCVVLAAPRFILSATEGATVPAMDVRDELTRRESIARALSSIGAEPEWLLDGTLVVTLRGIGTGTALDQAAMAARAALRIRQQWPDALVALATGRGSLKGSVPIGEAAERAMGLLTARQHVLSAPSAEQHGLAEAQSGVLLDTLSARLLERQFVVESPAGGPVLISEAIEGEEARRLLGKPIPCLGREIELGTLDLLLRSCTDESVCRAALITAPPGMGKSRLRQEFLRRVRVYEGELTLLEARGEMMCAGSPYILIAAALQRLCGLAGGESLAERQAQLEKRLLMHVPPSAHVRIREFLAELCGIALASPPSAELLGARQDPKLMRDLIRDAFVEWLAAECHAAPVLIILDDLQWGDGLSVALLDDALQQLSAQPLLILALARPEVHQVFPSLWQGRPVQEISLPALSKKACEKLVQLSLGAQAKPELVSRLSERSGGNALFLEELLRAAAQGEEVGSSDTIVAMLQARIARLSAEARRLVRASSVFGLSFWQGGVAEILGLQAESPEIVRALRELVTAEILSPQRTHKVVEENELIFRHVLMRDAAYGLMSADDLRVAHQRVAEYLQHRGDSDPMVLGEHHLAAAQPERALPFFISATMQSFMRSDDSMALKRVQRALICNPSSADLGALKAIEGLSLAYTGQMERALAALELAQTHCPVASTFWMLSTYGLLTSAVMAGQAEAAQSLARLYLTTEPLAEAQAPYALGLCTIGSVFAQMGLPQQAQLFLGRLEQLAQSLPEDRVIQNSHRWGRALLADATGQPLWQILAECEKAERGFTALSDWRMACWSATLISPILSAVGEPAAAMATARQGLERARRYEQYLAAGWLGAILGESLARQRETTAEAEQLIGPLLAMSLSPPTPARLLLVRACAALTRGELATAEELARTALKQSQQAPTFRLPCERLLLDIFLQQGRHGELIALGQQALALAPRNGQSASSRIAVGLALAQAHAATGDAEVAHRVLKEALAEIAAQAAQAPDEARRTKYLEQVPEVSQACALAQAWFGPGAGV